MSEPHLEGFVFSRTDPSIAALEAENAALREMLRKHQHIDNSGDEYDQICPECGEMPEGVPNKYYGKAYGGKPTYGIGHAPDCALAALLEPKP